MQSQDAALQLVVLFIIVSLVQARTGSFHILHGDIAVGAVVAAR